MDTKLRWDDHCRKIETKATSQLSALSALASSTWGTGLVNLRHIYRAIVIPQTLYGCSAWYTPGFQKVTRRSSAMVAAVTRLQRRAAQIITGALRTTAVTAVEVEAHLLPVIQQLEQTTLEAATRIRTTPLHEEMATRAEGELPTKVSRTSEHLSPLDQLSSILKVKYKIPLDLLETRVQHTVPPWWIPPSVHIAKDADKAIEQHDAVQPGAICIYSDGSSIDGHVGAAAVAPMAQAKKTVYMGTSTTSTVYAAELKGLALALQIASTLDAGTSRYCIFADNQAALQALRNPQRPSGQYILIEAVRALDELRDRGLDLEFRWIPAHVGVAGNS